MKGKKLGRLVGIMSMTLAAALVAGVLIGGGNVQSNASCNEQASGTLESNNGFLNRFFNKNHNTSENVIVDETYEVVEDFVDDSEIEGLLNTKILEVEDIQDTLSYEQEIEQLLNNDEIDEVCVVDNSLIENVDLKNIQEIPTSSGIGQWSVKIYDVKKGKDYCGKTEVAAAIGSPGINLTISKTKSVGRTYSLSLTSKDIKVGKAVINAAVGYNVSSSDSISISGSYKVPKKHNNKKVKNAKLTAHILYKQKNFKIKKLQHPGGKTFTNPSGKAKWKYAGSGYSRKPYGVKFKKTYTYKK